MMRNLNSGWVGRVHYVRILAIHTASWLCSIGLHSFTGSAENPDNDWCSFTEYTRHTVRKLDFKFSV